MLSGASIPVYTSCLHFLKAAWAVLSPVDAVVVVVVVVPERVREGQK